MQIPADGVQRDLPDCRCNVMQKELAKWGETKKKRDP